MINVLFVCLGNICRSPLAEGIFNHHLDKQGVSHLFMADSAGTNSFHIGELPDPRSRDVAADNGIDLVHKARAVHQTDFEKFHVLVAMDENNHRDLLRMKPEGSEARVVLMREFDLNATYNSVPDPYYGHKKDFEHVFEILTDCMPHFINWLVQHYHHDQK